MVHAPSICIKRQSAAPPAKTMVSATAAAKISRKPEWRSLPLQRDISRPVEQKPQYSPRTAIREEYHVINLAAASSFCALLSACAAWPATRPEDPTSSGGNDNTAMISQPT